MSHDDLEITCKRCGQVIRHTCNDELRNELISLFRITAEDPPPEAVFNEKNEYYTKGDEAAPIFSEAFLYTLLGKETARIILSHVEAIAKSAGFDLQQIYREAQESTGNERYERTGQDLKRFMAQERERSGQCLIVRLDPRAVQKLDVAVEAAAKTSESGWASRSSVLQTILVERFT